MPVDPKQLLRDALVGFVVGLVLTLGVGYGVSTANAQQAHAPASAQ